MLGPGPLAEHSRWQFTPDSEWQAARIAEAWTRNHSIEYLGDWHTHPDGPARFSGLDVSTAQQIAVSPDARQPNPVMLVVALSARRGPRLAAGRWDGRRLQRVHVVTT